MGATKYFINPFAIAGDVAPIPDDTQPSGAVSYQQGFTVDYELVQTDPSSKDIPRNQFNQLMLDTTRNIQQYQHVGSPNFITAIQNSGVAYPYDIYSIVIYDDGVNGPRRFMSKKNSNSSLPTVTADWLFLDNTASSSVIDNASLDGAVATGDAVYYDSVSSTFKKALANGSTPQRIIGFANVSTKRVFMNGVVGFLSGLTSGSVYYLSTTVPGALTTIQPTTNAVSVGIAKSATEIMINIQTDSFNPADLFTASILIDGYEKNNETGSIRQWGQIILPATGTTETSGTVTFPIVFPNNVFNIVTNIFVQPDPGNVCFSTCLSLTTSGVVIKGYSNGAFVATSPVNWQAIGN